ncbi:glycosyltransferase family 2 protein [Marinoscillum pacificum]|uniref:glycosyltransferase family 2 protein n=1 Tax=Marinoscillum pacificum TaxID=392723 RepID=UPI0021575D47|nr:glycosyltransferase family 2 protein [Marinoscillum pacificum]
MNQSQKKVIVVLPAYNASSTLRKTVEEIPIDWVSEIILVDDGSTDDTVEIANMLKISHIIQHLNNKGYGGNQKSCYKKAIELGADIIIMLHPDYQYTPKLLPAMIQIINSNLYQVVLGSRILGNGALKGGMPVYKYISNRALTFIQNLATGAKLSEYHTGYRAFEVSVLKQVNLDENSDDFIFDNQMLSQIIMAGYKISEVTCPTRYFKDASSISALRSIKYGLGVLLVSAQHLLHKTRLIKHRRYEQK